MPLYELTHVVHQYDHRPVLTIDRWTVEADGVTGIVGPNGSGKSTLLSLLGFLVPPTRGEILFNGKPARPFDEAVRGKVSLLPQEAFLLRRSVYANVAFGLKLGSVREDRHRRVTTAMEMVGLDPDVFSRRPWYALSGGEARRVALAARLALRPRVLLLDEPTTSVDAASAQLIREAALHAHREWGTALIITSHDAQWLADISHRVVHLFGGRILGNGQQSLIFGPWRSEGDRYVVRALSPDQDFVVHGVPENPGTAVAAVQADRLRLYADEIQVPGELRRLQGLLQRMSYEHSSDRIIASVLVGRTLLTAYLSQSDQDNCAFRPGQTVWLGYDPRQVAWY